MIEVKTISDGVPSITVNYYVEKHGGVRGHGGARRAWRSATSSIRA